MAIGIDIGHQWWRFGTAASSVDNRLKAKAEKTVY
jgi:hypothetical protein